MTQQRSRFGKWLVAGSVAVLGLGAIGSIGAVQAHGVFHDMKGGPFAGRMLERALGSVDATAEQRSKIEAIMKEAKAEIRTMTSGLDDSRKQFATLLAAETIDRAAVEALRQQTLKTGNAVSARGLEAFLNAADVLTPEQRAELIKQRKGFGPGFGRH